VSSEDWLAACQEAYPRVYRSLMAMGAAQADAADALQDAFERALKQRAPVQRPEAWLFVVALRRWRTARWRNRIFVTLGDRSVGQVAPPGEDAVTLIAELRRLPARERQVIVARYVLGLSQHETADAFGIATGTVAATTAHAAQKLRERLRENV
jgi:RNA polymerase sigma-70 factor, ECF subfamily